MYAKILERNGLLLRLDDSVLCSFRWIKIKTVFAIYGFTNVFHRKLGALNLYLRFNGIFPKFVLYSAIKKSTREITAEFMKIC